MALMNRKHRTGKESSRLNSYLVTVANASSLQSLLDTHGSVRLENGNYSASGDIIMSSGQKIYGYPNINIIGSITIENGSTDVYVSNVDATSLMFEVGNEINDCHFKGLKFTSINNNGASVSNCTFTNLDRCQLLFDCSGSGYSRNNIFKRVSTHTSSPQSLFKGNSTTPSYGNLELIRIFLTPGGDAGEYYDLDNHTIIGMDCESWNYNNTGTKGVLYSRGVGDFKMGNISGGNNGSYDTLPFYDIEADNVSLFVSMVEDNISNPSFIRADSNYFQMYSRDLIIIPDTPTNGLNVQAMHELENEFLINGVNTSTLLTGGIFSTVKNILSLGSPSEIKKSEYDYLAYATGIKWASDRIGKTDQSAFIQNLIDTNNIAELDEGIYYVSQSIILSNGKGILGKGMGKTAIIAITDDFPILEEIKDTSVSSFNSSYYIQDLMLQGGNAAIHLAHSGGNNFQANYSVFENVMFKDNTYGIHLDKFYGFDNIVFDNVHFVNNTIGFYQDPDYTTGVGEQNWIMYVDKVMFNDCKFINCGTGLSMLANRADNLNAWVGCIFDRCGIPVEMNGHNYPLFVDTIFRNTTGDYIVKGAQNNIVSFYSCHFENNSIIEFFANKKVFLDNCTSTDTVDLMKLDAVYDQKQLLITNSTLANTLGDVNDGVLINSLINTDATLSKKLVRITNDVPTVLIDELSVPTPQLVVTQ